MMFCRNSAYSRLAQCGELIRGTQDLPRKCQMPVVVLRWLVSFPGLAYFLGSIPCCSIYCWAALVPFPHPHLVNIRRPNPPFCFARSPGVVALTFHPPRNAQVGIDNVGWMPGISLSGQWGMRRRPSRMPRGKPVLQRDVAVLGPGPRDTARVRAPTLTSPSLSTLLHGRNRRESHPLPPVSTTAAVVILLTILMAPGRGPGPR